MTSSTDDQLVSTDWLAARLDDPKVKIIDASYKMPGVLPLPSDDYLAAHIPGAVFFNVNTIADSNDPRPHMYPDAAQFARDVSALSPSFSRWNSASAVWAVASPLSAAFSIQ